MTLSTLLREQKNGEIAQIIPQKLYFATFDCKMFDDQNFVFVNIDDYVHYDAFYDDFGPLNLSVLYRFCEMLHAIIQSKEKRKIFAYTCSNVRNCINGIYLIASYMVIYHKLTADQAYIRIQNVEPPSFVGFRDASMGPPTYLLHVQHVIKAVEKAFNFGWLNFKTFDPDEYEFYERVENGDLNWIIPNKILSFCGPHDRSYTENEYCYHAPEVYFDFFRQHNVSTIIRLNRKVYDAKRFTNAGFKHCDLFFIDGSTPSDEIVLKFINIVEKASGAVAIHCKAGLGRTGTLIACWMMKNFKMTAPQCMAWLRICRPGSVIGPQQQFLLEKQQWCWLLGQKQPVLDKLSLNTKISLKESNISTINANSTIQPSKIKCKITNNVTNNEDNPNLKSKVVVTRLTKEFNDFNFTDFISTDKSLPKLYPLRSKKSSEKLFAYDTKKDVKRALIYETSVNKQGQSQGDRLCEMKAKAQKQSKNQQMVADQLDLTLNNEKVVNNKVVSRYSSATTPIKHLKLSSSRKIENVNFSTYATPTISTYATPTISTGFRNISKVTVSSNCRPSILRNSTKKFLTVRKKPYFPANCIALDYAKFNVGLLNKGEKDNNNISKSLSTSSINSKNLANLSKNNYQMPVKENLTKKYELRPRIQPPSRFNPATTLLSNNQTLLPNRTRKLLQTSKSVSGFY